MIGLFEVNILFIYFQIECTNDVTSDMIYSLGRIDFIFILIFFTIIYYSFLTNVEECPSVLLLEIVSEHTYYMEFHIDFWF